MDGPPDPRKTNPPDPDSLAAEGEGGGDREAITKRLARYGTAKGRSYQMAGYLVKHHEDALSHRLYRCGQHLHFREWVAHDGRITLHHGMFCQVPLLCPVCAIRRGGKMLRRYTERAAFLLRDHDAYMVTLTVKNGDDLAERYQHLRKGLQRLRKRAAKGYGAFAQARGSVGSYEFTRSDEHGWHPHVHMVWFVPRGVHIEGGAGSQLSLDWQAITGDSFIVDARPLYGDLTGAFCEVLKYALKFSTLDLADNLAAFRTLRGRRLITSHGCMYGLELPEDARLEDDALDGPYIEMVYRWASSRGYVLHDSWIGDGGALPSPSVGTTIAPQEATSDDDTYPPQTLGADQGDVDARAARALARSGRPARAGTGNRRVDGDRQLHGADGEQLGCCGADGRVALGADGAFPAGRAWTPDEAGGVSRALADTPHCQETEP